MGARIETGANWIEARAPLTGTLRGLDLDCNHIPDAAMTLATMALFAEGDTMLRNIASWRVKETDRIAAMATELRKLGTSVEEGTDFIRITPPCASSLRLQVASIPMTITAWPCVFRWRRSVCLLRINDRVAWPKPFLTISSVSPW